jgi:hypothetical protein
MSKFVGFIVGAALVVVGIVTGNPYLIIQGGAMIVSNAVMLLTMPKQPARQASEMSIQLGEQPRCMLIGETFAAGSLVDGFNYGGKYGTDHEVLIIRLADHLCEGLTGFYVNDEYVPYTHDGNYPQFDTHHLSVWFRADTTNDPLPTVVTDNWPHYDATDQGESGCDVIVDYLADAPDAEHPAWPGGRPRFGFVVKGKKQYDPRKDDTVPGGVGAHRWDDPATWEWSDNCVVCWYNFERGVYANDDVTDQTKLLVGRGLSAEETPPENIFAAANLCDEVVGGVYPYESISIATSNAFLSPDGTIMVQGGISGFNVVSMYSRTIIATADTVTMCPIIAVNNDGSFYTGGNGQGDPPLSIALVEPDGSYTILSPDTFYGGIWHIGDMLYGRTATHLVQAAYSLPDTGGEVSGLDPGFFATWYAEDLNSLAWAGGPPLSGGNFTAAVGFYRMDGGGSSFIVSTAAADDAYFFFNADGNAVVYQADKLYIVNMTTQVVDFGPISAPVSGSESAPFRSAQPGDAWIWVGLTRYSSTDLSVLQSEDVSNWGAGTGISSPIFDRINDAIWSRGTTDTATTIRFLDRHSGYRIAGPIYANQEFLDVEEMFAAACAGSILTHEGQVLLEPGQAKSITSTFSDDDLLTGSSVNWNQGILSDSNQEWVNTVVARYVEPSQKWNDHAAPVVRDPADILTDGKPREASITLRLVRYQPQALRIAEITRRLGRIWGRATVKLGPRFCEIEEGDWVQWQSARYGFTKTFRVEAYSIDEKWQIALTLREISGTVFVADGVFATDHSLAIPTIPPPAVGTPDAGNWTLTAITLDSDGASAPALEIAGSTSDDPYVETVIIEYWKDDGVGDPIADPDSVSWIMEGSHPPSTTLVDITSVIGGATYYAAVTYVVDGEAGDRLVLGPVTLSDYAPTAFYQLEDSFTPVHLEDDATLVHLG